MPFFKKILKFYLDASIHVALAILCLFWLTHKDLNIFIDANLSGFVFFSSIICYNFIKYGVEAEKYFIVNKPYHKLIQVFSFLCAPLVFYFFIKIDGVLWLPIVVLTLISALYAIPFLPKSKNLRSLGGFKIYLVALVWVGFTVMLPVFNARLPFDGQIGLLLLERFILVLLLFIPFEIRDLNYDSPELKTLPQRFGVKRTKQLGYYGILIMVIIGIFRTGLTLQSTFEYSITALLLGGLIYLTKREQSKYFSSFWVEGVPVVMVAIRFMFRV